MLSDAITEISEVPEAPDSGSPENIRYPLAPTLFAIMLAWLCGFDSAGKAELFWDINLENLKKLIPNFPDHRISCDTINRILSLITEDSLQEILSQFARLLTEQHGEAEHAPGQEFPEAASDDKHFPQELFYVTLSDSVQGLSLGMPENSPREIANKTCVRAIEMLDLAGTVVTSDALSATRSVAEAIMRQGGDYVTAVKDNQKTLLKVIRNAFRNPLLIRECGEAHESETDLGHGRIAERTVTALPISAVKNKTAFGEWKKDCQTLFMGITASYLRNQKAEEEPLTEFFVSSLSFDNTGIAALGDRALREHRGTANQRPWRLDLDFGRDQLQIKNRNYLRNCEALSGLALKVLKELKPLPEFNRSTRKEVQSLTGVRVFLQGRLEQHLETVARLLANGAV